MNQDFTSPKKSNICLKQKEKQIRCFTWKKPFLHQQWPKKKNSCKLKIPQPPTPITFLMVCPWMTSKFEDGRSQWTIQLWSIPIENVQKIRVLVKQSPQVSMWIYFCSSRRKTSLKVKLLCDQTQEGKIGSMRRHYVNSSLVLFVSENIQNSLTLNQMFSLATQSEL